MHAPDDGAGAVSCEMCTCDGCMRVKQRRQASEDKRRQGASKRAAMIAESKQRKAMLWMLWNTGVDRATLARLFGTNVTNVSRLRASYATKLWERATLFPYTWTGNSDAATRRLHSVGAIPIRQPGYLAEWGDYLSDVDLPPDNWLTRHKDRDPRNAK